MLRVDRLEFALGRSIIEQATFTRARLKGFITPLEKLLCCHLVASTNLQKARVDSLLKTSPGLISQMFSETIIAIVEQNDVTLSAFN